ncbi:diguanylate cyclase domain-containing protein [Vibrio sp. 10N]|uniref:diguanylate cyclase domain-containing protein n=1 Tax=Vibrio sp. 10N TaxID=3058938 RepID=UPI00403ECBF1
MKDYPSLKLSISIGVAKCTNSQSVKQIIGKADIALYQAKESGRNCIVYEEGFEFG